MYLLIFTLSIREIEIAVHESSEYGSIVEVEVITLVKLKQPIELFDLTTGLPDRVLQSLDYFGQSKLGLRFSTNAAIASFESGCVESCTVIFCS